VDKTPSVRILTLKNADATVVADMISRLFLQAYQAGRITGKTVEPVAVSADVRSNAIVVAASEEQFKVVERLVNQIDELNPVRGTPELIPLKNANPDDVLKAIQQIYGSGANGRITRRPRRAGAAGVAGGSGPEATVLSGQRALLVSGSKEQMEAVRKIVAELEKAAESAKREVLVFPLNKAPNVQVAQALNNLYRAARRPDHPEDFVSVAALAGTNAVVVTAAKEKMQEVSALIKQLDVEVATETEFRIFPLVNTSATKILPALQQMIQPLQQARPNQRINLTIDARANTIIVSTQAPVLEEIAKIIKVLDAAAPFKEAAVAIIPLRNADAAALAEALTDMLTPGTSRVQTPEAKALQEQIRLLRLVRGKQDLPPLDLSKPIKITADPMRRGQPGSNSLIISSTPENIRALREIVALLDTLPVAAGVKVRVVHLRNADALAVMPLLREVFTQGWRLRGRPASPTGAKAVRPEGLTGEALTGFFHVAADARTNALVLAGTEAAVALAEVIVKDLDRQQPSEFTEVKVFKLAHADADRLAGLIRAVFAEQPARVPGVEGARTFATRLRMLINRRGPVDARIARSHPTLVVQADAQANLLVVAARSDLIPIISELVKAMDIPGAGSMNVVRIYPLKNADASRLAAVINGLYTGPNANLIRPEDRPTITVDTRTNALVIAASERTYALIDALLGKLDAKLPIDLRDIRLIPLKNAEASALASTLQQMMDARVQRQQSLGAKDAEALRMIIIPDPRSNFLIVGGSAEGFKLVEDLAKRLDSAAPALSGQIQLLTLKNANAGTLSASLNNLFTQRYQAARDPALQRLKPVIVPDLRTNILMVAANQDDSRIITNLVATLDARPPDPAVQLVVLPLRYNDAGSVGPVIQRIFDARLQAMTAIGQQVAPQDRVSVATDALSNALVISASKENLALIRELLKKVDISPPTETGVVRMYALQHADVQRVAAMLQSLVQQGLYKPGLVSAADNRIAQAREKVSITTDIRTNVLIVSASRENFAVIEEILKKVDVAEGWALGGGIKVYVLKHADAARLGPTLQQMFDRKRAAEAQATGAQPRSLPVVVIPDERTNALLVAASREGFAEVDAMVRQLDAPDVVQTHDFRVFYLKQASAAALEPTLRQLFAQRRPAGRAPTPVTIIADPKINALIIGAHKDDLTVAEGLIARLDQAPPPAGQTVRAFPIAKADANQLASTLQRLYDATRPTGGTSGVAISVDERSNTILVSAAKADMDAIADLIAKLDTPTVTDVTEIRIFTLQHADAAQLATILTDALTSKPAPMTGESPNRAKLLRLIAEAPDGQKLIASALKQGVQITAVPRTNSLLVQAPVETMKLLGQLIRALDQTDPRMAEIRVIPLINGDAAQMQRVLTELFRLQQSYTARQSARYTMVGALAPDAGDRRAGATFGAAEQAALSITVDYRTNSLLVGGTREYVDLVERIVRELDASPAEERQTIVYRLRNAQATDIEQALRSFLDQERQRVVSTMGANASRPSPPWSASSTSPPRRCWCRCCWRRWRWTIPPSSGWSGASSAAPATARWASPPTSGSSPTASPSTSPAATSPCCCGRFRPRAAWRCSPGRRSSPPTTSRRRSTSASASRSSPARR